jgi:ectoine hydroxylase-related dioxygenase (phytanoyl-CoA dioxygenase family)
MIPAGYRRSGGIVTASADARSPATLTDGQLREFHEKGFVIVRGLLDPEWMKQIASWTDEIQHWPEVAGRYMMYFEETADEPARRLLNRVEDIVSFHEGMASLMRSDEMQGAVSRLFGEPAILLKDKINFKMPGGGGFAAHQDVQAGWDRYGSLHITAMLSIDRATRENGCLEFAPSVHDRGLIGERWAPLTDDQLGTGAYELYPTEPGDAVFFDSFAPHRSAPNRTGAPRRVLYFTYGRASEGDQRSRYYADKRESYPPDIEREAGKEYVFRV